LTEAAVKLLLEHPNYLAGQGAILQRPFGSTRDGATFCELMLSAAPMGGSAYFGNPD
jgi:hypothetical protein